MKQPIKLIVKQTKLPFQVFMLNSIVLRDTLLYFFSFTNFHTHNKITFTNGLITFTNGLRDQDCSLF